MNKCKKECVYKGCSCTNLNSDKTLFRFPSQESKYDDWVKRSKCKNSWSPFPKQFLCEDHFDSIYKTCNQRRKFLLSTAVPYMCELTDDICEQEDSETETEKEIIEEPKQKKAKIIDLPLEDKELDKDEVSEQEDEEEEEQEDEQEEDFEVLQILESEPIEEENCTTIVDPQNLIIVPFEGEIIVKPPAQIKKPKRDQSLVTTFIFKGEEYIQMPKDMFEEQESAIKQYLKLDYQREQKNTENKLKILENAFITERKEMETFVTSFKELVKKYELVVEENKIYKAAVDKAKEALNLIPE